MASKTKIAKIAGIVDGLFASLKLRFLPSGKRLEWYSSLPAVYRAAVEAHGGTPSTETENHLVEIAESYLDAIRARLQARMLAQGLGSETAEEAGTQGTPQTAGQILDSAEHEVARVVEAETQNARSLGAVEGISQVAAAHGVEDPVVFFVVVRDKDLCEECLRLHVMPDGNTPRLYKLSEVSTGYHVHGSDTPAINGLHPHCFTGSQRLHTEKGLHTFKQLFDSQDCLEVVVDRRVKPRRVGGNQFGVEIPGEYSFHRHSSGTILRPATRIYDTGKRECLRITLVSGQSIEVSADHEMWVDEGNKGARKVNACEVKINDKIPLVSGPTPMVGEDFADLAELMGNLLGDGYLGDTACWHFFGPEIEYGKRLREMALRYTSQKKHMPQIQAPNNKYNVPSWHFNSTCLSQKLQQEFGLCKKPRRVPDRLWCANEKTVAAFLRGLFSSDGHSELNAVVLSQNDLEFLKEIQTLLSMFGLNSRIHKHGDAQEKSIRYADGREFITRRKACWRLHLSGYHDVLKFQRHIGFGPLCKQERLQECLKADAGGQKWRTARVISIKPIGIQQTYSLTEPMTNTVTVNGIVTGQCRCSLSYLAPGFGFNTRGYVQFVAPGYDALEAQRRGA